MTENEVRNMLKACDREIESEYSKFRVDVNAVGEAAAKAASSYRMMSIMIPLVVGFVIGLAIFGNHPFLGFICIVGGAYFGFSLSKTAKDNIKRIEFSRNQLSNANRADHLDV